MSWTKDRPFQALALTGGGYRGLFTARALQEMEDHIGEPIGRRFDLSYGTSIGGIIALAVAFEVPMQKVVQAAGRVIRTPQDRGVVHLIDDRFRRPEVLALLPRWWAVQPRDYPEAPSPNSPDALWM